MNPGINKWKIATLSLLLILGVLVSAYFYNSYVVNQNTGSDQETSEIEEFSGFEDFVDVEDLELTEVEPVDDEPPIVDVESEEETEQGDEYESKYGWKLSLNGEWREELSDSHRIPAERAEEFVEFFDSAIERLDNVGDYTLYSDTISTYKAPRHGTLFATQGVVTIKGPVSESIDRSCEIKNLTKDNSYDCATPTKEYISREVQDEEDPNVYHLYSKRPGEDWEVSKTDTYTEESGRDSWGNWFLMKDAYNPKNLLRLTSDYYPEILGGTLRIEVVGAINNPKGIGGSYGEGLDVVYLRVTDHPDNKPDYYIVNLSGGLVYRIVEYREFISGFAEHIYDWDQE
jgi:hypothetical protein